MRVNLTSYRIRNIPSFIDFHSSHQVLHLQVYHNGLKIWISKDIICIDKWNKIKYKVPKNVWW